VSPAESISLEESESSPRGKTSSSIGINDGLRTNSPRRRPLPLAEWSAPESSGDSLSAPDLFFPLPTATPHFVGSTHNLKRDELTHDAHTKPIGNSWELPCPKEATVMNDNPMILLMSGYLGTAI
jgi:hypothetical protein